MVKLHVNDSAINTFDGRGVADSTLDAVAAACCVTTMNTTQTHLIDYNSMLATRSGCIDITFSSGENLDVLHARKEFVSSN